MVEPDERTTDGSPPPATQRAIRLFLGVPRAIVGILILVAIGINFANVVGRYVFSAPIIWAEEVMVFIVIWCVFLGAVLVTWDRNHLKMDLFSARLPGRWRPIVNGAELVVTIAVCCFMILQAQTVVELMIRNGQTSVAAQVPMSLPHTAVLLGFVLIVIALLVRWRRYLSGTIDDSAPTDSGPGGGAGPDERGSASFPTGT